MNKGHRLIQTFLVDGTLEGIRIIDPEGDIEAYVIPRLKLGEAKHEKKLAQPALYILLNAEDNRAYIGESENFLARASQHLKSKDWWTLAVAIVSKTNGLEKGDVKYLESLAIERARGGSVAIENSTIPPRNNIHRFKIHQLDKILDDIQLALTSLGYDVLSSPEQNQQQETIWHCKSKRSDARATFKGDQFIILAGSRIDTTYTDTWGSAYPGALEFRNTTLATKADTIDGVATLTDNIAFRSPNSAGGFVVGHSVNAWMAWKNAAGRTMDEVMRRGE